jgi:hypothetical protein
LFARLIVGIAMLVHCFNTREILEDHLAGAEDDGAPSFFAQRVELSGLMTFFFQIFYLQHVINKYIAVPQEIVL